MEGFVFLPGMIRGSGVSENERHWRLAMRWCDGAFIVWRRAVTEHSI